jgi:hypothetical protein
MSNDDWTNPEARAYADALFGRREVDPDELRTDEERAGREFAAGFFGSKTPTEEEPARDPKAGSVVPHEGSNPAAKPDPNDHREFVRSVFN